MKRPLAVYSLLVLSCSFVACVSTTLDVPADHPASPQYPVAPVTTTSTLVTETPALPGTPQPAPEHSHPHHHGGAP